ncbi:MAG: hypothetical protein AAGA48_37345 [Myxococcota bacterium]
MHIFLTRELRSWIAEEVETGEYLSEGHLVRSALRMLQQHIRDSREPAPPREERPDDGARVLPQGPVPATNTSDVPVVR